MWLGVAALDAFLSSIRAKPMHWSHYGGAVVFLVNLFVTYIMCGALWLTQLSYYPLLGVVGRLDREVYDAAEHAHIRRVSGVAWLMLSIELATSALLLWTRPRAFAFPAALAGLALIVLIWLSTLGLQNRYHKMLAVAFRPEIQRLLVQTNWIRVVAWTARVFILMSVIGRLLRDAA